MSAGAVVIKPVPGSGFDPTKLVWAAGDEPVSQKCSYCAEPIGEDACPLIMWRENGACVRFCDPCMQRYFGFSPLEAQDPDC